MKRQIPNLITLLNLFCGCIAVVFAVLNKLDLAAVLVLLGIFFDFLDGLAARLLNVRSDIGVQLDSLADMVTSGVVPGIVMFQLMNMAHFGGWNSPFLTAKTESMSWSGGQFFPLSFTAFIITLSSAYRLAKFNVDENQVYSFKGLPTPANALLILSLPLILLHQNNEFLSSLLLNQWFLIGITLLSAFLLNAPIHLFSLKFKGVGFKENSIKYLFLIGSIVLLVTLRFLAIPAIIAFYIFASFWDKSSS